MRITTVLLALGLAGLLSCSATSNGELPVTGGSPSPLVATAAYGVVRGVDGNPIPDVMINATSLDQPPRAIPELAVMTSTLGAYEWPLAPGRYRLIATVANIGSQDLEVTVVDGQRVQADFDLGR